MLSASSDKHFREWIGQNPSSVALFSAPWCKACKRAKPEVAQTLQQQSVPSIEVDADTMEEITEEHKVTKLPTVLVFKNGAPVGRASGPNASDLIAIVVSCGLLENIEKSAADSDAPPAKRARVDGKEHSQAVPIQGAASGAGADGVAAVSCSNGQAHVGSKRSEPDASSPPVPTLTDKIIPDGFEGVVKTDWTPSEASLFVKATELQVGAPVSTIGHKLDKSHQDIVGNAFASSPGALPSDELESMLRYRIPNLTDDGTCGVGLQAQPFDLGAEILGLSPGTILPPTDPRIIRLWRLRQIVQALARATGAEWVGLYRKVDRQQAQEQESEAAAAKRTAAEARARAGRGPAGADKPTAIGGHEDAPVVLVKEAYVGSASRPYFPLTEAFAAKSNNSTVAMTKKTMVYHHVDAVHDGAGKGEEANGEATGAASGQHEETPSSKAASLSSSSSSSSSSSPAPSSSSSATAAADGRSGASPYYVCDTRVQFELCAPILDSRTGEVLGILDLEAWRPRHLARAGVALALQVCQRLGEMGPAFSGEAGSV